MGNTAKAFRGPRQRTWHPPRWLCACIAGALSLPSITFSQVPTFDELKADYVENLRACGDLRVTWTVQTRMTKDSVENMRAEQALLQEAVSSGVEDDVRRAVRERLDEIEAALPDGDASDVEIQANYDLWTDHQGLQLRSPSAYHEFDGKFPDAPVVEASDLVESYSEFSVLSWPGNGEPATVWPGLKPESPIKRGVISQRTPAKLDTVQFPPLGYIHAAWGHETQSHLIDRFFFEEHSQNTVESTSVPGDEARKAWLVRRSSTDAPRGPILEAVIDPQRGFIPVRIRRFVLQRDDSEFDVDTCECELIKEVTPGVWYPRRSTIRRFEQDYRAGAEKTGEGVPSLLSRVESWVVQRVTPGADMSLANYRVGLPDMTLYYDEQSGKHRLAGGSDEDAEKVMDQLAAQRSAQTQEGVIPLDEPQPRRDAWIWLVVANVCGVLVLLTLWSLRRRANRSS
ncbi:hypothetical protein Mal4_01320 [Maioricimonas rarisocia]|uniref:Uncharacterized protein n=1 Tax=Maioricimonas rarisocia TaxID=2528026 RepID=A0A517Z028_9PLAN|nr:hypothetical protein [Maioricimonas rarisocia]QDU35850.1 hypothetical protein Mal4_01320 [Maioricimonas rarisocia]